MQRKSVAFFIVVQILAIFGGEKGKWLKYWRLLIIKKKGLKDRIESVFPGKDTLRVERAGTGCKKIGAAGGK